LENGRIEALSDGVFAIAITLLTLELKVPTIEGVNSSAALWEGLRAEWPSYLAFVTSFGTIFVMWINHHGVFREIRAADPLLMFANGFLLLLVATTPFPTAVLANFLDEPAAPLACSFFAGFYVLINLGFALIWLTIAYKRRLLRETISDDTVRVRSLGLLAGFIFYLWAAGIAFVSPAISLATVSALWVFWAWFAVRRHSTLS
jgi:uncharacterized membrane protein